MSCSEALSVREEIRLVLSNPSATLLLSSGGVASYGAYTAWQCVLPIVGSEKGRQGYNADQGDIFAFTSGVVYCIGGFLGGAVADK